MIDTKIFNAGMDRLETWDTSYEISPIIRAAWLKELNNLQIDSTDFTKGLDFIFSNPVDFKKRPALPELIKNCGDAKFRRWQYEEDKKKNTVSFKELNSPTTHGKRALKLIRLFIAGGYEKDGEWVELTKREKVDYMLKMDELYPERGWASEAMKLANYYGLS